MRTVYLCGPINGCTDSQANDWRTHAKAKLIHATLDPMRRDYRGKEDQSVPEIVNGDIEDINNSTDLLVSAPVASWGTAMEIFYAHVKGKTVATVVPRGSRISPWLRYHSTKLFEDLDKAIEWLNSSDSKS